MGIILKTIRLILLGPLVAINSILWVIICLTNPAHPKWTSYAANSYGQIGKWILGYRLDIENKDILKNTDKNIIVSNHQSNYDIFYIGEICPRMTVSVGKKAIIYFPFFGMMYWITGNILIDRGNKRKAWSVMDKVVERIKEGVSVWIMPEGTRSKGRGLLPFKKGAFVVSIKSGRPIIPVCVDNFHEKVDITKFNSGTLKVKVLEPISPEGYTLDNIQDYIEHVRNKMIEALESIS